jgi:hypothetical protein
MVWRFFQRHDTQQVNAHIGRFLAENGLDGGGNLLR